MHKIWRRSDVSIFWDISSSFPFYLGHDPAWYDVTMAEMRACLGLIIFMGINKLPDYKLHWSRNKFFGNSGFIDVMPVRRYEKITQYLHCSSTDIADPLCKIRPILNLVSENIGNSYKPRQHQTIEGIEGMIAYKGRHKVKQISSQLLYIFIIYLYLIFIYYDHLHVIYLWFVIIDWKTTDPQFQFVQKRVMS